MGTVRCSISSAALLLKISTGRCGSSTGKTKRTFMPTLDSSTRLTLHARANRNLLMKFPGQPLARHSDLQTYDKSHASQTAEHVAALCTQTHPKSQNSNKTGTRRRVAEREQRVWAYTNPQGCVAGRSAAQASKWAQKLPLGETNALRTACMASGSQLPRPPSRPRRFCFWAACAACSCCMRARKAAVTSSSPS